MPSRATLLAALVVALLSTACATYGWINAQPVSTQQFAKDRFECRFASRGQISDPSTALAISQAATPTSGGSAMSGYAAGYANTLAIGAPAAFAYRQQQDLYELCMEARGYSWQRTDR